MATTKCLLYCTKAKPYLIEYENDNDYISYLEYRLEESLKDLCFEEKILNGKIVVECEVETKEICFEKISNGVGYDYHYTLPNGDYIDGSCLSDVEMQNYLGEKNGYALFIKNLKTKILSFDKDCIFKKPHGNEVITRAPQNMQWCFDRRGNRYVLISIRPEWLCKILNEEKTIEIRRKVLKGMCDDE